MEQINYYLYNGNNVKIALIDSGVNLLNQKIKHNILRGYSLHTNLKNEILYSQEESYDYCMHGTCCAEEIINIASGCKILPIRIFDQQLDSNSLMLINAINIAIENDVNIINISAGTTNNKYYHLLKDVCLKAYHKHIVIVASECNEYMLTLPAYLNKVIGVRGVNYFNNIYSYKITNSKGIDILACGRRNIIESMNKKYSLYGSSFATAHVSGIIAVAMQQYNTRGYNEVLSILSTSR